MGNEKVKILLKFVDFCPAYIFLREENYEAREDECVLAITVKDFTPKIMQIFYDYFHEIFQLQKKLMEDGEENGKE